MAGNYFNGQGGSITVLPQIGLAKTFCVSTWSGNWQTEALDVTTTCSNSWRDLIPGISQIDVTADSFYDPTLDDMTIAGLGLTPGSYVTLTLQLGNSTSNISGLALVDSVTFDNPAKGVVGFKLSAKSTGAWAFQL